MFGDGPRPYDRVECDLEDVLGSPGINTSDLAGSITSAFGGDWRRMEVTDSDTLFLEGAFEGGIGAFGGDVSPPLLAILEGEGSKSESMSVGLARSPTGTHDLRQQTMFGHRVVGGTFGVHVERGSIAVTGHPIGDLRRRDPGPAPTHTTPEIWAAMRAHADLPEEVELAVEPVIFPLEGSLVWAYQGRGVVEVNDQLADILLFVQGGDLSLLISADMSMSSEGEATVFRSNPTRGANLVTVRVDGLADDTDMLSGPTIDVVPGQGARSTSQIRDWRIGPGEPGFDEVSAYYHLTTTAAWFSSIVGPDFLNKPPFTPLRARTGVRSARDYVGVFMPGSGELLFGDGKAGNEELGGARCADICAHEFTHAFVFGSTGIGSDVTSNGASGLNEGYADYAQASLLDNPVFGDWVEPTQKRDCSNPDLRFPNPIEDGGRYKIGAAFAAALWELRQQVGVGVADAIALNSIFYLDPGSKAIDARAALLRSDSQLFPTGGGQGRHQDEISSSFDTRL